MATLADLEEQKRELEARLQADDVSAEAALSRVDRAIAARRQKIAHSHKRLDAARNAVKAGMSVDEARRPGAKSSARSKAKPGGPLNRFE